MRKMFKYFLEMYQMRRKMKMQEAWWVLTMQGK